MPATFCSRPSSCGLQSPTRREISRARADSSRRSLTERAAGNRRKGVMTRAMTRIPVMAPGRKPSRRSAVARGPRERRTGEQGALDDAHDDREHHLGQAQGDDEGQQAQQGVGGREGGEGGAHPLRQGAGHGQGHGHGGEEPDQAQRPADEPPAQAPQAEEDDHPQEHQVDHVQPAQAGEEGGCAGGVNGHLGQPLSRAGVLCAPQGQPPSPSCDVGRGHSIGGALLAQFYPTPRSPVGRGGRLPARRWPCAGARGGAKLPPCTPARLLRRDDQWTPPLCARCSPPTWSPCAG